MKTNRNILVVVALVFAAPVSAATVNIADGETWCDSADKLLNTSVCSNPLGTDDLSQTVGSDSITFAGSGSLWGFVQDGDGQSSNWADAAMVTLSSASKITISLEEPTDALFDGSFSFGDLVFADSVLDASNSSLTFSVEAGTYAFLFDATAPNQDIANTSEYSLSVAAVPLPAGGLLLLSALGGLVSAQRRKKAAN